jgi:hypothetical protein
MPQMRTHKRKGENEWTIKTNPLLAVVALIFLEH